jgi:hypothetical protein
MKASSSSEYFGGVVFAGGRVRVRPLFEVTDAVV